MLRSFWHMVAPVAAKRDRIEVSRVQMMQIELIDGEMLIFGSLLMVDVMG